MMKDRIERWICSAAGKISIVMFVTSVILILIACSDLGSSWMTERQAENANNILFGIATNLIGIIVTVSFVQYFLDKQDEEVEREEERRTILRYDRYMSTLIRRYAMFHVMITTRLKDRKDIDYDHPLDHNFKLSDLADMYRSSSYLSEGFAEPTAELFYKAEGELKAYVLRMLENIEFKYNPELEELLISFAEKSTDMDVRGQILEKCMKRKNKIREDQVELIEKIIADESQDWMAMFGRGELQGNLMLIYVTLFILLQDQSRMLKEYREYINGLREMERKRKMEHR